MIRQAHTYLVSAMSGATLIAIAIAAFVFLVSAQVFRDWPIAALGGDGDAGVSKAKPVAGDAAAGGAAAATGLAPGAKAASGNGGASNPAPDGQRQVALGAGHDSSDTGAFPTGTGNTAPPGSAGSPAAGGGGTTPQSSSPAATGGSSSGTASSGSGQSGGGSGGGGGGNTGGGPTPGATAPSTSGAVNETVNKVDEEALGGTLGSTGVTGVTEGVVNGAVGPESTVGKVADETVDTVGKLLGR